MNALAILMMVQLLAQAETSLGRAGRLAELFWDQFTAVESVERITQARLRDDGKVLSSRTTEFDYVALLKPKAGALAVEEARVARTEAAPDQMNQFLLTTGFPSLLLLFHPDYKDKFDFEESQAGDEPSGIVRVTFTSKPGERSLSAIKFNGRFFPILWRGFAWIERKTGAVVRIGASLGEPMEDIGVSALRAEVEYRPVPLQEVGTSYHLPARVTVTVRTPRQQWRNVHEYSQYKLFTVTTVTRGEAAEK
jgi:hypothetical protein